MIISNDIMHHRMALLEERVFRRWCTSHIVNNNFTIHLEKVKEEFMIAFWALGLLFSDEVEGNDIV